MRRIIVPQKEERCRGARSDVCEDKRGNLELPTVWVAKGRVGWKKRGTVGRDNKKA